MININKQSLQTIIKQALAEFIRYPILSEALRYRKLTQPCHILALGKAAWQMAFIASNSINQNLLGKCIILSKYGFHPQIESPSFAAQILEAGHPIPDANSINHSRYIVNWLQNIPFEDELLVLLSGGSSALFEIPANNYSLEDLCALNSLLLKSGLDIAQINAKRKQYSAVKGGKAAKYFKGNKLSVFLLSDVPGNDPAIIGSGPFYLQNAHNHVIIGDNQAFLKLLAKALKRHYSQLHVYVSPYFLQDDATTFAKALAKYAMKAKPGIYLFGGECNLKVQAKGKGGRLSHLALCFANALSLSRELTLCAFATDGNDNLAQNGGSVVNQDTLKMLQDIGNPDDALINFDSFTILEQAGAILPGFYTGCNVNDVIMMIIL